MPAPLNTPGGPTPDNEVLAYLADLDAQLAAERDAAERKLLALDASLGTIVDPGELADAYVDRAAAHDTLGDSERAMRDYAKALELATDPTQVVGIKLRTALQLLSDGQRRVSFSRAIDAVNDDVGRAGSWHVLGLIAGHCEFFHFAIDALRRAVSLDPRNAPAMKLLGTYLREIGQFRDAAEVLTRYVVENPREPKGWY